MRFTRASPARPTSSFTCPISRRSAPFTFAISGSEAGAVPVFADFAVARPRMARRGAAFFIAFFVDIASSRIRLDPRRKTDPAAERRFPDDNLQASRAGLFLLGADHEPRGDPLVRGRLTGEVAPRLCVRLESFGVGRRQLRGFPLLEAVDSGSCLGSCFERANAGRAHAFLSGELGDATHVHCAPDAARAPRSEAN